MQRTVIIAFAMTVDIDGPLPQLSDADELLVWMQTRDKLARDASTPFQLAGVWDRDVPESNQTPEVFAAYEEDRARPERWCF